MAEDKIETPVVVEEVPEKEYSEVEQSALAQGWQDKDEWVASGHKEGEHRSAREFVDRGELLGKLKANSQEVRQLRDTLAQMTVHNQKVYQAGIEQGLKQLKQERRQATLAGDTEHALALEDKIDTQEETLQQVRYQTAQIQNQASNAIPQQSVEFQDWVQRNPWYLEDPVLHHWSKGMAIEYARVNPNATEAECYNFLDREVRKNFPAKFKKAAPPNPDGGGRQTQGSAKANNGKSEFEKLLATMPEDEQRAARRFVAGGLKEEKYVEDYRLINDRSR